MFYTKACQLKHIHCLLTVLIILCEEYLPSTNLNFKSTIWHFTDYA